MTQTIEKGGEGVVLPKGWHNHPGYRDIFNAALTGFVANKDFHGPVSQGKPWAAVAFAYDTVREAVGLLAHLEAEAAKSSEPHP